MTFCIVQAANHCKALYSSFQWTNSNCKSQMWALSKFQTFMDALFLFISVKGFISSRKSVCTIVTMLEGSIASWCLPNMQSLPLWMCTVQLIKELISQEHIFPVINCPLSMILEQFIIGRKGTLCVPFYFLQSYHNIYFSAILQIIIITIHFIYRALYTTERCLT